MRDDGRDPVRAERRCQRRLSGNGGGAFDLVLVPGFFSHLELDWEYPGMARMLDRLGSFARLIRFDKRGTGLSDRTVGLPDFETRMDDVRAVMDSTGSKQAALFGYSEGGPMCVLFAATYPERTRALVLYGTYAKRRDPRTRTPVGPNRGRAARVRARPRGHLGRERRHLDDVAERRRSDARLVPAAGAGLAEPGRGS